MKKLLLKTTVFFIFSIAFYVVLVILCGSYAPIFLRKNLNYRMGSLGHMNTRMKEIPKVGKVDILFLGSSHVYRGFDTRVFEKAGYKTFNLGSSSQTPLQTKALLDDYLNIFQPRLVVLDLYPGSLSSDGVESSLDVIANSRITPATLRMAANVNSIKTYNTLIYGLYRQIFNLNKNFKEPLKKWRDTYVPGGYVEHELTFYKHISQPADSLPPLSKQIVATDEILQTLRDAAIPVLLVQVPITKEMNKAYRNLSVYDSIFREKGNYVDFNGKLNLNDSLHFQDRSHLNQTGAELLSRSILPFINSILPAN